MADSSDKAEDAMDSQKQCSSTSEQSDKEDNDVCLGLKTVERPKSPIDNCRTDDVDYGARIIKRELIEDEDPSELIKPNSVLELENKGDKQSEVRVDVTDTKPSAIDILSKIQPNSSSCLKKDDVVESSIQLLEAIKDELDESTNSKTDVSIGDQVDKERDQEESYSSHNNVELGGDVVIKEHAKSSKEDWEKIEVPVCEKSIELSLLNDKIKDIKQEPKECDRDKSIDEDDRSDEEASEMTTLEIIDVRTVLETASSMKVDNHDEMDIDECLDVEVEDTKKNILAKIEAADIKSSVDEIINELLNKITDSNDQTKVKFEKLDEGVEKSASTPTKSTAAPIVGRQCSVCGKMKACKYQVLMLGMTKFLCDDVCFKEFRLKQKISIASAATTASVKELAVLSQETIAPNRPVTRSITHPKDVCNQCKKEIRNGQGLLPGVGENKPLCSEECMKAYQATQGLKRACAQCGGHILGRSRCLTWETMEYCNEECLGKYQSYLGSHCAFCQQGVQQTSLGKYCVRFGSDIKQFCSNGCLEEFKKGLKICSYCQKDITNGTDGFLAPVGDKGQFKEFCSHGCMEKFETMGNPMPIRPSIQQCSVCSKVTSVKVEVTFEGKVHRLCSEPCIAAFRYANKINTSICDTCHKFFDLDVTRQLSIQFEGTCKRFCTKACTNVFVLHHRKVVPCSWCKVKKYNFDMIERVDSNNHVQLFCSLNCLSLFRVSLNATSSRRVQCDYCHQSKPAQYHLTMSDASIRNFCSYPCVMQFQSQFTAVAPAPLTAPPVADTTSSSADVTSDQASGSQDIADVQGGTPIISSVMSLAPSQGLNTIVIKPSTTPAVTTKVAHTQTLYPAISQHIIVKQPPVKMQKNKTISCKPTVQTKGVSCKPHPCHKSVQTDVDQKQLIIPVPVPIYVPVPMHMFNRPVPFPIAFPVPIPVPIFIPTTKNSTQSIFRQIKEITEKIPDNPFEADLILMAEMVAEDSSPSKSDKDKDRRRSIKSADHVRSTLLTNELTVGANDANEEVSRGPFDDEVESQLSESCQQTSNSFGELNDFLMSSGMDGPNNPSVDLETALTTSSNGGGNESNSMDSAVVAVAPVTTHDENGSFLTSKSELKSSSRSHKRNRGGRGGSSGGTRGRKRARFESDAAREGSPTHDAERRANLPHPPPPFSYGVNAWKHWVMQKNTQLENQSDGGIGPKGNAKSKPARRLKLFKTDLLQLTADELNYSLCLFVKEVRKPDGGEYAADSVYYLCLGIQQYLFESGRVDNIFADSYYEKFTECLNDVLVNYEMALVSQGVFLSRIEEEILWNSKQLGAHSPHVLLNTLMYFNTKFFMLKSVNDHTQLSFSHILKHWKKGPTMGGSSAAAKAAAAAAVASGATPGRSALLRYYPPSQMKDSSRRRKEVPSYEQVENLDNPLRCPVKLYEFYLSKCPECIKNRNDVFYLYPERSCVPDSPVWYSTQPLGKETIAKMLQRIKMVREVGETMMMPS